MNEKKPELKNCELCKSTKATIFCMKCYINYCEECSNFMHQKKSNINHKLEKLDENLSLDIKCYLHQREDLSLFCLQDKGFL